MELSKQIVSLELAKKLKELGVKQESLHLWQYVYAHKGYEIDNGDLDPSMTFSAFTVAELGEMLPEYANVNGMQTWFCDKENGKWRCGFRYNINTVQKADTESDARAKMLIYLLENKLI